VIPSATFLWLSSRASAETFTDETDRKFYDTAKANCMEWNEEEQDWYVSIVDVVGVLTDQTTQRGASNYWAKLKDSAEKNNNHTISRTYREKVRLCGLSFAPL
jgi:hypothetical protein